MDLDNLMSHEDAMKNERPETQGPGPNTKGGGLRGGPKRWTGRGPPPARHIPWPEIFKHHISLIEGHLKMTDMVRKHTVEGTGNWQTIMGIIDRTRAMLTESRQMARNFVEPSSGRTKVPIGSSSVSMYPGYSPADHVYGKAAEEYGKAYTQAKAAGEEFPEDPNIEYVVGQGRGAKRPRPGGESNASEKPNNQTLRDGEDAPRHESNGIASESLSNGANGTNPPSGDNPYFVVDTRPTPVKLNNTAKAEISTESEDGPTSKRHKHKHKGDLPAAPNEISDISNEVDARLKKKEEKLKKREEKKRKRESRASELGPDEAHPDPAVAAASEPVKPSGNGKEAEKPKKKKSKAKHEYESDLPDRTKEKKRKGSVDADGEEVGKDKKRKKSKDGKKAKS